MTSKDVARAAGVSQATVSRVLNHGQVSPEMQARVLAAIQDLGYRPNAVARSLIRRKTELVGVLASDFASPLHAELLERLEAELAKAGYRTLLLRAKRVGPGIHKQMELFIEQRVAGVVLPEEGHALSVRTLRAGKIPVVVIGESRGDRELSIVVINNSEGARLAGKLLIELGHTRIAFVRGARHSASSQTREAAFASILTSSGTSSARLLYVEDGLFTYDGGRAAGHRLLERSPRPTAIFAANDLMAFGVLDAAAERHLRVPADLSVVGFDDIAMASWRRWLLTTVRQPAARMAQAAVESLISEIERHRYGEHLGERRVFSPELVVRSTTGPACMDPSEISLGRSD